MCHPGDNGMAKGGKKWTKFNNNLLLFKIGILVKEKDIDLHLHKVKGHSNDFWNDEADELARDGLSNLHVFRNTFSYSNSQIQWMPHYGDNRTPIEQSPRKFLKEILNSYNCKAWTDLKINNGKFDPNNQQFEWTVTFNVINQVKHFKCNSSRRNSFWAFSIKMLQGLLPLGPILKQRHPSWYRNFTCTLCPNKEEENILHLQECPGLTNLWNNLRTNLDIYISSLWDSWPTEINPTLRQKCLHYILGNSST